MRDLTKAEINILFDELVGTAGDIDVHLEQFGVELLDLSEDTLSEIDQMMFQCDVCGWWCEAGECANNELEGGHADEGFPIHDSDELICQDCA